MALRERPRLRDARGYPLALDLRAGPMSKQPRTGPGGPRSSDGRPPRRRRLALKLIGSLLITLVLLEAVLRVMTSADPATGIERIAGIPLLPLRADEGVVTAWYELQQDTRYFVLDPSLGWCVGPDADVGGGYSSDSRGVRRASGRSYADDPPPGIVRIVTVGDSFTHGDEVRDGETWQAGLERLDPGLEVLNLGVGGYGTDQAFLRWRRDGRVRRGHVSVLGIWPEDICRNLNVCRFYMAVGSSFLTKPRFVSGPGALTLVNHPVSPPAVVAQAIAGRPGDLVAHERWRSPWEVEDRFWYCARIARLGASVWSRFARRQAQDAMYCGADPVALEITEQIVTTFAREAAEAGSEPVVLFLPMRELLDDYPEERSFPLLRRLQESGIAVVDLTVAIREAVAELGADQVFLPSGHYTPRTNAIVARRLLEELRPTIGRIRGS